MSEISDEILKRGAADSDITAFRDECFSAWTTYRDAMEDAGEWADITDYRTGFFVGVCAGLNAHATLVERFEAMLEAAWYIEFDQWAIYNNYPFAGKPGDGKIRLFKKNETNQSFDVREFDSVLEAYEARETFEATQEGRDG